MSLRHFAPPGFAITPATAEDRRYMDLNCHVGLWSKHLANKLGAVIVDDAGHILSLGFNGHREGVEDGDPRNWTKPERYIHSVHAEDNALLNARLNGIPVEGATMHVLRFPCSGDASCGLEGCSQKIIAGGLGTVVVYSPPEDANHAMTPGFRTSLDLLIRNGIALRWHDPNDQTYYPRMVPRPDTRPVPSGSVDWPARFLDLATYIAGWEPGGIGEVIVRRPFRQDGLERTDPALSDRLGKIVRAMGCAPKGALETADALGLPLGDCTMFMSTACGRDRGRELAKAGIRHIVVPAGYEQETAETARTLGLRYSAMKPALQPAPA